MWAVRGISHVPVSVFMKRQWRHKRSAARLVFILWHVLVWAQTYNTERISQEHNRCEFCPHFSPQINPRWSASRVHGEKSVFDVSFLKCLLKVKSTLNPAPEKEELVTKTSESSMFVYVNKSLIKENSVNTLSDYISADCLRTSSSSRLNHIFNPFYWKSVVLTLSLLNVSHFSVFREKGLMLKNTNH